MNSRSIHAPAARIVLCEKASSTRDSDIRCEVGTNLIVNPEVLGQYCFRQLHPYVYDLVLITGAVAFADRMVPRKTSVCWRRELEVVVPTSQPEFWKQGVLLRNLTETLELLTGDVWSFRFTPAKKSPKVDPQAPLAFGGRPAAVIAFSDGLDSFATARLETARTPQMGLIKVTTGGGRHTRPLGGQHRVSIPFSMPENGVRLRETSYRSRSFKFGVMAGIAANLLEADRIVVPESGQGALGPWLNPVGNEAPDVRMHPFFMAKLARFLNSVFGREIKHEHPQLWKTKGQTLRELKDKGLEKDWWKTK